MRNLPEPFTTEERTKWENGLRQLWNQYEMNAADTPQHQEAKRKIVEFSRTLSGKLQAAKFKAQQQGMQGQPGQSNQPGPQMPQGEQTRPSNQGQPPQQQNQVGSNPGGNPSPAQQRQPPKIPPKLQDHVERFPYVLPPGMARDSPEAAAWLVKSKNEYLKALINMESHSARVIAIDGLIAKRNESNNPLSAQEEKDAKEKRENHHKAHNEAKNVVESFRKQQAQYRVQNAQVANVQAQGNNSSASGLPSNGNSGGGSSGVGGPPVRPQMNPQQVPNPTQTVNAAIEAARNQQMMGANRSGMSGAPQQNGQLGQSQMPGQNGPPTMPPGQMPNIKTEAGLPAQINTAITQMQNQHRPGMQTNSPQSAVPRSAGVPNSAISQGQQSQIPQALSHADAISQANRSYSNTQPSNSIMGHSHPTAPRENNVITNKMPIPKHLPERATATPQPVPMQQARPTYSGGANNVASVMNQPAIPKVPQFNMESDAERVLSKKKLDELVRQVTGGGQGGIDGGEGLTPDVEESILNVADNFVDQVLAAACKNAKERGSKILEIRDIQLTLERGYNIRIPGYSSDEIRTLPRSPVARTTIDATAAKIHRREFMEGVHFWLAFIGWHHCRGANAWI
ncbi:uncharacterized protein L3040_009603 [Drepanopeziza brunnea f. sp. 'multigermtubi']|uniref:uncharacterized protein n=1 Tax=Drepanopeziza brunnea f. sp. 'multigermtubi' TaxID=698441 RepID=UPI0023A5EDD4|nr:hypothetical protein L3040_009603 [Drepanopeziza brunnea f. sp. 'multigermtubi']